MFEEQEFKKIILLIKTCTVISMVAAVFVICTHWRGFHLSITPPATSDTRVVVVERPAPAHRRKTRVVTVAPEESEPEAEEETPSSYEPPPRLHVRPLPRVNSISTGVDLETWRGNIEADRLPSSPLYSEAPAADFSVTVHPKKHRWPRRFFGAIGHGMRKVVTFGH